MKIKMEKNKFNENLDITADFTRFNLNFLAIFNKLLNFFCISRYPVTKKIYLKRSQNHFPPLTRGTKISIKLLKISFKTYLYSQKCKEKFSI